MDFDKIKYQWESSFKREEHLNNEQLLALLKLKDSSNTALKKLIRNQPAAMQSGSPITGNQARNNAGQPQC